MIERLSPCTCSLSLFDKEILTVNAVMTITLPATFLFLPVVTLLLKPSCLLDLHLDNVFQAKSQQNHRSATFLTNSQPHNLRSVLEKRICEHVLKHFRSSRATDSYSYNRTLLFSNYDASQRRKPQVFLAGKLLKQGAQFSLT